MKTKQFVKSEKEKQTTEIMAEEIRNAIQARKKNREKERGLQISKISNIFVMYIIIARTDTHACVLYTKEYNHLYYLDFYVYMLTIMLTSM